MFVTKSFDQAFVYENKIHFCNKRRKIQKLTDKTSRIGIGAGQKELYI